VKHLQDLVSRKEDGPWRVVFIHRYRIVEDDNAQDVGASWNEQVSGGGG
jgi:hypothetical protein